MKNDVILKLLEDLPDDLIESAAEPEPRRNPVFLRYAVPAIAACMVIVLAAVIYPKLRTETPERTEESVISAETALPVTGTGITGTEPAPGQDGTGTDPYSVHIITAPAITFTGAHGTAKTTAQTDTQAEPDDPQADDPQDNSNEDGGSAKDIPAESSARRTTAPVSTRTTAKSTATTARSRQQTTFTDLAAQITKPVIPGTMPNEVVTTDSRNNQPAQQGEDNAASPERNDRIPCDYTKLRIAGGGPKGSEPDPSFGAPTDHGAPTTDKPVLGEARLDGNILRISVLTPCTDAIISYLALQNGELQLEVYYDRKYGGSTGLNFEVTIPWEFVRRIRTVSPEFYEVDNTEDYDHDDKQITLVIL